MKLAMSIELLTLKRLVKKELFLQITHWHKALLLNPSSSCTRFSVSHLLLRVTLKFLTLNQFNYTSHLCACTNRLSHDLPICYYDAQLILLSNRHKRNIKLRQQCLVVIAANRRVFSRSITYFMISALAYLWIFYCANVTCPSWLFHSNVFT